MAKHNDDFIRKVVTKGFEKQRRAGLSQGAYAMCTIILGKANDGSRSAEDRLNDIIAFCTQCTKPADKIPDESFVDGAHDLPTE